METSFKDTLEEIRKEISSQKNAEYHERMKSIVDEAIKTIDIDTMKQSLIKQVKTQPQSKVCAVQWEFSLDPLFVDTLIWTADNKYITNPIKPLELYFHYKNTNIKYTCTKQDSSKTEEFSDYLYSTDPDIQRLKNIFKEAFPGATIKPWVYIQRDTKAYMSINISYTLTSGYDIFEKIVSEPYREFRGGVVTW